MDRNVYKPRIILNLQDSFDPHFNLTMITPIQRKGTGQVSLVYDRAYQTEDLRV